MSSTPPAPWSRDAAVEAVARTTGLARQTRTDDAGQYRLPGLQHGTYLLTVSKDSFQTVIHDDVRLEVGQVRTLDVTLAVGAITSEVTVIAQTATVDTKTAEIGASVTGAQIEAIPLNGRNWASMMAFAPGATNTSEGGQNNIRFFGRARDDNNWTFDGVDATGVKDPRTEASLRLVMSTEAISEFRVSSTNFTADAGTGAGAQVNVVSKSGGNEFHGSAFEYFRDEALDERRILDPLPDEPPFRLNQYRLLDRRPDRAQQDLLLRRLRRAPAAARHRERSSGAGPEPRVPVAGVGGTAGPRARDRGLSARNLVDERS